MAVSQHFAVMVVLIFFSKCVISEEDDPLIRYELAITTPQYDYEKILRKNATISSEKNAFSITVLDDFPILKKGMLQISPDTFYFYMDYHNLTEIEPGAFDDQNITEQIRLEGNNLTRIQSWTFKNLKIKELNLAYNKITHIEENAIADMLDLWSVHLSRNQIVQFHATSFVNTPKMWSIDLSFNKLKKLRKNWFSFMDKDRAVIVGAAFNEIEEIHPEAFENIDVWNLILNHNKLRKIPREVFESNKLKLLMLQNNLLENLPDEFFEQTDLNEAALTDNPLNCTFQAKLKKFRDDLQTRIYFDSHNC